MDGKEPRAVSFSFFYELGYDNELIINELLYKLYYENMRKLVLFIVFCFDRW